MPQRTVRGKRLGIDDIEPGAGEPSTAECRDQVRSDGALAAADADEVRARFERLEEFPIENAGGLGSERRTVHDEVGLARQLRQLLRQSDVAYEVRSTAPGRTRGSHPHAECMGAPRDLG